jgi:hypothetical protein
MKNVEVGFTPFTPLERSGFSLITQHPIVLHSSLKKEPKSDE